MCRQRFETWSRKPWVQVWFWGFLGSAAAEVFNWYNLRTSLAFPAYVRSFKYWLITMLMAIFGGVIATLYIDKITEARQRLLAFHIGVSAPLILALLVRSAPGAVEEAIIPPGAAEKVIMETRQNEAIATQLELELNELERCVLEAEPCNPATVKELVSTIELYPELWTQLQPELDLLEDYVNKLESPGVVPFLAGGGLQF